MCDQVCHEILDTSGCVSWEAVAGLEVAKKLLQEMIVWPMTNPALFTVCVPSCVTLQAAAWRRVDGSMITLQQTQLLNDWTQSMK
jgi:hypothetical protein